MNIFAISSEHENLDQVLEELHLSINYRGEKIDLPVEAYAYGYTYRLAVKNGGQVITFEPDEEGCFRAFADAKTDKELIAAIAMELEKLK